MFPSFSVGYWILEGILRKSLWQEVKVEISGKRVGDRQGGPSQLQPRGIHWSGHSVFRGLRTPSPTIYFDLI